MTKEEFTNLKITDIKCRKCERSLPVKHFTYSTMHIDNTGICRSCVWIKNNREKMEKLKEVYDEALIIDAIHFIYESEDGNLCDFATEKQMPLEKAIDIATALSIGNKKLLVKVECECCGKLAEYVPSAYKNTEHHYCSHECYYKDKARITPHGEESIYYNRIKTKCSNCSKPLDIIPSQYEKINRFGDNHNFCSHQCYWEYRSRYYVGKKSNRDLIKWTPELIEKMRINKAKSMVRDDRLNTKPQIIVNNILDSIGVS